MRLITISAAAAVLAGCVNAGDGRIGRYQMEVNSANGGVYKMDTTTGQAWVIGEQTKWTWVELKSKD